MIRETLFGRKIPVVSDRPRILTRRRLLSASAGLGLAAVSRAAPGLMVSAQERPQITCGVQSGDITSDRAIVWSRTDRPARMVVRYATTPRFENARIRRSDPTNVTEDFTARIDLSGLPPGQRVFYEVRFESRSGEMSEPATGSFSTPARTPRPFTLVWGGDTAGQGWGIDTSRGGMRIYESMRRLEPGLFVHSGDLIYADGPIPASVTLDDGSEWRNVVTEEVATVAETLRQFRGRYRYNLLDEHLRRFNAEVPMIAQWDDHETLNNWYPGERLGDAGPETRYREKDVNTLASRANQAFREYVPIRLNRSDPRRVFRRQPLGPLAEVFVLDCRSYRSANSPNRQPQPGPDTVMLGATQLAWLEHALAQSGAVWKIVACDMPLGIVVTDGPSAYEAWANADPEVLGREHEIARLLGALQTRRVRNVVWITADVHYAAAHEYHPSRARFTRFDPFWEFVAGPLHAGTFGPGALDPTFGPALKFCAIPTGMKPNRPPSDGLQFFGVLAVDPATLAATVTLRSREGAVLYTQTLPAHDDTRRPSP
jgi:alkaline phosphatase D